MPSQADGAEVTQSDSKEDSGEEVDAAWALWWGFLVLGKMQIPFQKAKQSLGPKEQYDHEPQGSQKSDRKED
ncbi:Thiamine Transporter 2 [Manis pentadactyla]|nr:Thiamine Transporter 2 [Manis pentadactyla]